MEKSRITEILIIPPGDGTYGEMFFTVLEHNSKDIPGDFQIYRMTYPHSYYQP